MQFYIQDFGIKPVKNFGRIEDDKRDFGMKYAKNFGRYCRFRSNLALFKDFYFVTGSEDSQIFDPTKALLPMIVTADFDIRQDVYLTSIFRIRNLFNSKIFLLTEKVINIKSAKK